MINTKKAYTKRLMKLKRYATNFLNIINQFKKLTKVFQFKSIQIKSNLTYN